jgi:hypothetical protein
LLLLRQFFKLNEIMLIFTEGAQSECHTHVEDIDGDVTQDAMNIRKREFFEVLKLVEGLESSIKFDTAGKDCVDVNEHHLFEGEDIFIYGAELEYNDPEEDLKNAYGKVQVVEFGTDPFHILKRNAQVFVFHILIFVQQILSLFINEHVETYCSIYNEQQVHGEDVENVGEE